MCNFLNNVDLFKNTGTFRRDVRIHLIPKQPNTVWLLWDKMIPDARDGGIAYIVEKMLVCVRLEPLLRANAFDIT
jgi:hypothetical protein